MSSPSHTPAGLQLTSPRQRSIEVAVDTVEQVLEMDPRQKAVRCVIHEAVGGCSRIYELQSQARAGSDQRPLWQDHDLQDVTS